RRPRRRDGIRARPRAAPAVRPLRRRLRRATAQRPGAAAQGRRDARPPARRPGPAPLRARAVGRRLAWLRQDLLREDSEIAARAGRVAMVLGERLSADTSMRDWLNGWLRATVEPMVDRYRGSIRDFIVERVGRWDTRELVDELELSVGSDLQSIRYNGTAIGALIGGVLFGIVQLIAWLGR